MTATDTTTEPAAVSSDLTAFRMCACQHYLSAHDDGRCAAGGCGCTQPERVYSSADLVALSGASYRQIHYWVSTGLLNDNRGKDQLPPHQRWRIGSGHPLWFTAYQLDVVRLAVGLVRFGMVPSQAVAVAREVVQTDTFTHVLADVFELSITVRDTTPEPPSPEEGNQP